MIRIEKPELSMSLQGSLYIWMTSQHEGLDHGMQFLRRMQLGRTIPWKAEIQYLLRKSKDL